MMRRDGRAVADAPSPWTAVIGAMFVAATLSLLLGGPAPPAVDSLSELSSAAFGVLVGMSLRAVLVGAVAWLAVWFFLLRRWKWSPWDNLGFLVVAAALAATMAQWGLGVLIVSSPDNPRRIADRGAYLELAYRKRLAADARAFERQIGANSATGDLRETAAMTALAERVTTPRALGADPQLTKATAELQAAWEAMETYRALQPQREAETIAEAKGYRYGAAGSGPVIADFRARTANAAPTITAYWDLNAAVEADAEALVKLLAASRGAWRVEGGKLMGAPGFPTRRWQDLVAKLRADSRELAGPRGVVMTPAMGVARSLSAR